MEIFIVVTGINYEGFEIIKVTTEYKEALDIFYDYNKDSFSEAQTKVNFKQNETNYVEILTYTIEKP